MRIVVLAQRSRQVTAWALATVAACAGGATRAAAQYTSMAPDGHAIVYVLEGDSMFVCDVAHPDKVRPLGAGRLPVWAPDSRHVAYYAPQDGAWQLWVADMRSATARPLTHVPGGIDADETLRLTGWVYDPIRFTWSPDGARIAFAMLVDRPQEAATIADTGTAIAFPDDSAAPLVQTNTTPAEWATRRLFRHDVVTTFARGTVSNQPVAGTAGQLARHARARTTQLFVVDVGTGQLEQLTTDTANYFNPAWSPDGTTIVTASLEGRPALGYGPETSNLSLVNVRTHAVTPLTHGSGRKRLPQWSPDGRRIAYDFRRGYGLDAIHTVSVATGAVDTLTRQLGRGVMNFVWLPDSRTGVVSYEDGLLAPLAAIDVPTGRVTPLASGVTSYESLATSRTGAIVWVTWPDADTPAQLVMRAAVHSVQRSAPITLRSLEPPVSAADYGRQELIRWQNHRGDTIEGLVVFPASYRAGTHYPLIVDMYSQHRATPNRGWSEVRRLTAHGYVVFFPNHRAPHMWWNPMKTMAYDSAAAGLDGPAVLTDDVLSGIDSLAARGVIDTTRMCLNGFSNGGGSTLYLLTQTTRFRCAAVRAAAAVDRYESFFQSPEMANATRDLLSSTPWEQPERYRVLSPLYQADRIQTPVLLADGDDDHEFLLRVNELYTALRYLGRPVTFVRYPNEGHEMAPAAEADWERRMRAFFDSYLQPAASPATRGR